MNREARTFLRQFQCDAPANAPGTPRYQDSFSPEGHSYLHDCRAADVDGGAALVDAHLPLEFQGIAKPRVAGIGSRAAHAMVVIDARFRPSARVCGSMKGLAKTESTIEGATSVTRLPQLSISAKCVLGPRQRGLWL